MAEQPPYISHTGQAGTAGIALHLHTAVHNLPLEQGQLALEQLSAGREAIAVAAGEAMEGQLGDVIATLEEAIGHCGTGGALLQAGKEKITGYMARAGLATTTEAAGTQPAPEAAQAIHETKEQAAERKARIILREVADAKTRLTPLLETKNTQAYMEELFVLSPEALAVLLQQGLPHVDDVLVRRYSDALMKRAYGLWPGRTKTSLELGDLWVAGATEFLESCRKLQPGEGTVFVYGLGNAEKVMRNELKRIGQTVNIPRHTWEILSELAAMNAKRRANGQPPMTNTEIGACFNIKQGPPGEPNGALTVGTIRQAEVLAQGLASLEFETAHKGDGPEGHILQGFDTFKGTANAVPVAGEPAATPEQMLTDKALAADLRRLVATFPPDIQDWINLRFGLGNGTPCTVPEASSLLGIEDSIARSREDRMKRLLKKPLNRLLLRDYDADGSASDEVTDWPLSYEQQQARRGKPAI